MITLVFNDPPGDPMQVHGSGVVEHLDQRGVLAAPSGMRKLLVGWKVSGSHVRPPLVTAFHWPERTVAPP